MALRLAGAFRIVRLESRRLDRAGAVPDDVLAVERARGERQVARPREVAERVQAVAPPRLDDPQMVRRDERALVRVHGPRDGLGPFAVVGHRIRLASVDRVAEVARGVLGDERAELGVVEVHELGRVGEGRLDDHQRPGMPRRPLRRPILLFLQGGAVALVVHGREDRAAAAAGVLEDLARRVQRPHGLLRLPHARALVLVPRRHVVRVVKLRRILIPRIAARVEVRVPHDDGRMAAVDVEEARDVFRVGREGFILIGRHGEEVVEPHRVARRQVLRPGNLRKLGQRIEAHGVVVDFLDVRDVLPDRLGRPVVVAQARQPRTRPHPEARGHAVEEDFPVLHPGLAEAERAGREGVDRSVSVEKRDAHLVDLGRLHVPEDGLLPFFRPHDLLFGGAVQDDVPFGRVGDLSVAREREAHPRGTPNPGGVGDARAQRHRLLAVGGKRDGRREEHPARRRLEPHVPERDLVVVADGKLPLPERRVVPVDVDREHVGRPVRRQQGGDVQPPRVGDRREILASVLAEGADLLAVQVDAPGVGVQILEIEPDVVARGVFGRRERPLVPGGAVVRAVLALVVVHVGGRRDLAVLQLVEPPQGGAEAAWHAHVPPVARRRGEREVVHRLHAPVPVQRHAAADPVRAPLGVRKIPQGRLARRADNPVAPLEEGAFRQFALGDDPHPGRDQSLREIAGRPGERNPPLLGACQRPDERPVFDREGGRHGNAQVEGIRAFECLRARRRLEHEPQAPRRAHGGKRQPRRFLPFAGRERHQRRRARQAVRRAGEGEIEPRELRGGLERLRVAVHHQAEDFRRRQRRIVDAHVVVDAVARLGLEPVARPVAQGELHRVRTSAGKRPRCLALGEGLAVHVEDDFIVLGVPGEGDMRPDVLLEDVLLQDLHLLGRHDRKIRHAPFVLGHVEAERLPVFLPAADDRMTARLVLRPVRLEPERHRAGLRIEPLQRVRDEARRLVVGVPAHVEPLSRDALRPGLAPVDDALLRLGPRPHERLARPVQREYVQRLGRNGVPQPQTNPKRENGPPNGPCPPPILLDHACVQLSLFTPFRSIANIRSLRKENPPQRKCKANPCATTFTLSPVITGPEASFSHARSTLRPFKGSVFNVHFAASRRWILPAEIKR